MVKRTIDSIGSGLFSNGDRGLFADLVATILDPANPYLLLHDFEAYVRCQVEVSRTFRDKRSWCRKSILNVARMGKFSIDRTIREYAREIWGV